jgi:hypothetical protein
LERVQILEDKDPLIFERKELVCCTQITVNDYPIRRNHWRIPQHDVLKISNRPGRNIVDLEVRIFKSCVEQGAFMRVVGTSV